MVELSLLVPITRTAHQTIVRFEIRFFELLSTHTSQHFFCRKIALVANFICLWKPTLNKVSYHMTSRLGVK